jgi:cytosine/adenosine deaminase-related metal-dependent hydrolase
MRLSAEMARHYGVRLHTHLAENDHDIAYSLEKFKRTPAQYAEALGWVGHDVWHAHCVKLDDEGISLFAATRTGIAHCPCSNMRLASGILPLRKMLDAGVPIGLGVDGSASNDAAHLLNEARLALLLTRVVHGAGAMTPEQALEMATLEGARNLGRSADLGSLEAGKCADLAVFPAEDLFSNGADNAVHGLVLCHPRNVDTLLIQGEVRVREGQLTGVELPKLLEKHRKTARRFHDRLRRAK